MHQLDKEDIEAHTNESCVTKFQSGSSSNVGRKYTKRLPLADIRNVQEDLSRRFDGERIYLMLNK